MNKKVIIFGNGQMASIAHFYLKHDSDYKVEAFTVDAAFLKENRFEDCPLVAFEEVRKTFSPEEYSMFLPLSYAKLNKIRAEKYERAKAMGYSLINYVSSKATVWPGLKMGDNCFILENNVIQPFVEIGSDVILWSGNHIGHHSIIQDHCYVASHAVISGRVTIEPFCFVGVNATIRDNVTVRKECILGAGTLILKNTEEREVYAGRTTDLFPKTSDRVSKL